MQAMADNAEIGHRNYTPPAYGVPLLIEGIKALGNEYVELF